MINIIQIFFDFFLINLPGLSYIACYSNNYYKSTAFIFCDYQNNR
jgi:hypothetical protein